MAGLGYIIGGALQGLGEGIAKDGLAKREEARLALKEASDNAREDKRYAQQEKIQGLKSQFDMERSTMLEDRRDKRAQEAEDRRDERLNKRLDAKDSGGKNGGKDSKGDDSDAPGGISASDKRLWDAVVQAHTRKIPATDTESAREEVDWEAVSRTLQAQGRNDLSAQIDPATATAVIGPTGGHGAQFGNDPLGIRRK